MFQIPYKNTGSQMRKEIQSGKMMVEYYNADLNFYKCVLCHLNKGSFLRAQEPTLMFRKME